MKRGQHMNREKAIKRFWSKVKKTSGCWLWMGFRLGGYGYWVAGYGICGAPQVHHVSWFLANKRKPRDQVFHTCDNPPCVNPDHLFEGSNADNVADKVRKGRQARGEMGRHKLTTAQVQMIRWLGDHGWNRRRLSEKFGISQPHVSFILLRRSWKHV
jgi:hypothetical protein